MTLFIRINTKAAGYKTFQKLTFHATVPSVKSILAQMT